VDNQLAIFTDSDTVEGDSALTFNGSTLTVTGHVLPGTDNTYDLGSSTKRFANVYTGDLHLQNERGHWQIVEEADCLTVINRLTNKKYKMVLEPYETE
jgi:hypothetical protein